MTLLIIAPIGTTEFQHRSLRECFRPEFGDDSLFDARRAAALMAGLDLAARSEVLSSSRNLPVLRRLATDHEGDTVHVLTVTTDQDPPRYSDTADLGPLFEHLIRDEIPHANVHDLCLRCDPTDGAQVRRGLERGLVAPPASDWLSSATRVVVLIGSTPQIRNALDELVPVFVSAAAPVMKARLEGGDVKFAAVDAVDARELPIRALLQRALAERLEAMGRELVLSPEFTKFLSPEWTSRIHAALATPAGSIERRSLLSELRGAEPL